MGNSDSSPNVVDRLAEDIVERFRRGERPTLDEYVAGHPAYADELREVFPALILLESIKPRSDDSGCDAAVRRGSEPPLRSSAISALCARWAAAAWALCTKLNKRRSGGKWR